MNILELMKERRIYFDGGMGSLLQARGLKPGELPETWNLSRPEIITEIHREYIEAGAFNGCTALTDITIPESVGYIKTGAFKDCSALTSVTIRDDCRLDMNVFPTTVEVNHSEG